MRHERASKFCSRIASVLKVREMFWYKTAKHLFRHLLGIGFWLQRPAGLVVISIWIILKISYAIRTKRAAWS